MSNAQLCWTCMALELALQLRSSRLSFCPRLFPVRTRRATLIVSEMHFDDLQAEYGAFLAITAAPVS